MKFIVTKSVNDKPIAIRVDQIEAVVESRDSAYKTFIHVLSDPENPYIAHETYSTVMLRIINATKGE